MENTPVPAPAPARPSLPFDNPRAPNRLTSKFSSTWRENATANVSNKNLGKIFITIFLLFLTIYVIVYVYKMYMSSSLKTTTVLKTPISIPYTETNLTRDVQLPANIVGNQYSLAFWIYVDGVPPTSKDKFMISRGSNLEMFLDKKNSLIVDIGKRMEYSNFPTNRWVSVILIVDESLATLYIDGKFVEAKQGNYLAINGNVIVGKPDYREKVDGYMSKVQVFNYALTIDHTQIIYKSGPLHKSILSMIGVPMYGLRNPFVRLDEVSPNK